MLPSSLLNFGMFPYSAILISQFPTSYLKQAVLDSSDNIYLVSKSSLSFSRVDGLVLSQLQLHLLILTSAFSHSLAKLQNYSHCEFLIKSFEAPKSGKTATTKIYK